MLFRSADELQLILRIGPAACNMVEPPAGEGIPANCRVTLDQQEIPAAELPARVAEMLKKHRNLWADLAFRTDHGSGGRMDAAWRALFLQFPDRFMVGTDTYTPERWHYVGEHASWSRQWLSDLPRDVAERIAWKNGEQVFGSLLRSE